MEVSKISPAPRCTASVIHSKAFFPVGVRPPCKNTSQPEPSAVRFASTAHTTHCTPNSAAISLMSCGRSTADVFTLTLSAPARKIPRASSSARMPPPTVKGINTSAAVRSTTSIMVLRLSEDAVISRNTNSSAPCWSYRAASSTGSPASRRSTKFTPFTTRPLVTSRQGMTRATSITASPHLLQQ